jgi:hypothetical protein
MDALYLARRGGLEPSENAWRVQQALLRVAKAPEDRLLSSLYGHPGLGSPSLFLLHPAVFLELPIQRAAVNTEEVSRVFLLPLTPL